MTEIDLHIRHIRSRITEFIGWVLAMVVAAGDALARLQKADAAHKQMLRGLKDFGKLVTDPDLVRFRLRSIIVSQT